MNTEQACSSSSLFGFAYSPLNSAKLSCSSEVTLSSVRENPNLRTISECFANTNCFLFGHSEQIMYTACSESVLSSQFSCNELVIQ